jgi:hypothetical protein
LSRITAGVTRAPARPDRDARGPAPEGVGSAPARRSGAGTIRNGAGSPRPGSSSSHRLRVSSAAKPWGLDPGSAGSPPRPALSYDPIYGLNQQDLTWKAERFTLAPRDGNVSRHRWLWLAANGKQGTGIAYGSEYFRGMVAGLAPADAVDATVSFSVAAFTIERGYEVEVLYSGQSMQHHERCAPPENATDYQRRARAPPRGVPSHHHGVFLRTRTQRPDARAAEIRAGDRDPCSSSILPRAAPNRRRPSPNFSRAWYNGTDYRFDLTALRALDDDLVEHCLAVL